MVKIKLLLLFSFGLVWSQTFAQTKAPGDTVRAGLNGSEKTTVKNGSIAVEVEVLFATNEDCDLFIDDQPKGLVSKKEYRYIKLTPGEHSYKAKSKSSASELTESFQVENEKSNEVFIDLLYAIEESQNVPTTAVNSVSTTTLGVDSTDDETSEQLRIAAATELLSSMVSIKGGKFVMGNNNSTAGDELEHPVTVRNVLFSKYEVTQQQWQNVMGTNPSQNKGCATCPVENVSWEDAMKFIRRINVASNKRFRLPTEAEWEYVAKIGGKSEIDSAGGQEEYIKKTAWYFANSDKKTHPVGEKQPNILGIYDLYGNVSEWCFDWYASYYYKDDDSQRSPEGPPLGKEKVVRGGSFSEYIGDRFRPSLRNKLKPTTKIGNVGFRLVMDIY